MSTTTTEDTGREMRDYRIDIPQADLDDLRDRLVRTRWPDELPSAGWDYGVPQEYLRDLVDYWRTDYDWRTHETKLNAYPQFTTTIDGQNVHVLHVRSPEPDAVPLILTHGWPGSIVEFVAMIGPLTDPRAHGGDPASAFHVVVPSLPGFGLSGPTTEPGWGPERIAAAWLELMSRLGYDTFGAHGGDFGAAISRQLGVIAPDRVIGVHLTELLSASVSAEDADFSDPTEKRSVEAGYRYQYQLSGYMWVQSQRPQTLAYGLADSPVGQLAWIVERFKEWSDSAATPDDAVDRGTLLTNVMLYWLTGTAASSSRIYREGGETWGEEEPESTVPTGMAVLPGNISVPVRRLAEQKNKIVHWTELPRGGHFPGLEVPDLLVDDLRTFFAPLR
jgi:epoxide hydrolase